MTDFLLYAFLPASASPLWLGHWAVLLSGDGWHTLATPLPIALCWVYL